MNKNKYIFLCLIITFLLLSCFVFFPFFSQQKSFATAPEIVKYEGPIEHLFTHCLIANPALAFDKKNPMAKHYDNDCLTIFEFKNILKELYSKNYVLIKASSIFTTKNGTPIKAPLYIPKGKKPLILSFDDVNYDRKKSGLGMVDKIVLDNNKNIATYTNGRPTYEYNNEFIPIIESFIKEHPDFSYNNARGLICLTGYDGILGYRTNDESPNKESEKNIAVEVVKKLKSLGWEFASHSYGHYHIKKISLDKFARDVKKWKDEVQSIVGKTQIYVYPYGEREIVDQEGNISKKHSLLESYDFKLFCGVGVKSYFNYLPNPANKKILFMDRTPLDGYTLRNNYMAIKHLFDVKKVYDNQNRQVKLKEFIL